jgi:hypothetical protein
VRDRLRSDEEREACQQVGNEDDKQDGVDGDANAAAYGEAQVKADG